MHHIAKLAAVFALSAFGCAASARSAAPPPGVVHHEAPGNLDSRYALGCITPDRISSTYTPADLYPAVADCIRQDRAEDAIVLYVVSGAYSLYDMLRVTDKSAHDAPALLRTHAFRPIGEQRMKEFSPKIVAYLQNEATHNDLCGKLLNLGPPRYFPSYMTQHGMDAFLAPDASKAVGDIDPAAAWLAVMSDYAKCEIVLPKPASEQR